MPDVVLTMSAAGAMTTLGAVPVFLLGAQSVFIRRDLHFDEARFGLAVSPTLWVSAILAFAVGWVWPGLMLFAVVRVGREAPGAA